MSNKFNRPLFELYDGSKICMIFILDLIWIQKLMSVNKSLMFGAHLFAYWYKIFIIHIKIVV
jgi:hypothetical protein